MSSPITLPPSSRYCLEIVPTPCVLVFWGATGDLFKRKLLPALFQLHQAKLLDPFSRIVGCGRTAHTDDSFRRLANDVLAEAPADAASRTAFLDRLSYVVTDPSAPASFHRLGGHLDAFDRADTPAPLGRLYYLAVPPEGTQPLIKQIAGVGLLDEPDHESRCRHVLIEKPFGSDSRTAAALDAFLKHHVREHQLFRIDHYLGKDTVQNILMLRFANRMFDPVWNAGNIDHVQITVAETLGVEGRARYYDSAGVLRDMFQNHILELLALVAMESPKAFDAASIQQAKLDLIRAIRPFPPDALPASIVRGQYTGYRREPGVAADSMTETFVAARMWVDAPRWRGVPFYVRSGKRLAARSTTITLVFKPSENRLFDATGPDRLTLQIQPDEGMRLNLQAKLPGPKLCMGDLPLAFRYADLGDTSSNPDGYARLLLDAMLHDHTLFVEHDAIAASWELFSPVLEAWAATPGRVPLQTYEAGSDAPEAAKDLLAHDGRAWEPLR